MCTRLRRRRTVCTRISDSSLPVAPRPQYLFTFYNAKSIEERKARIERVNKQVLHMVLLGCARDSAERRVAGAAPCGAQHERRHVRRPQLKNFYGPLLAAVTASRSAFRAMLQAHSPDGSKASSPA
jgi:hypothetical protein